MFEIWTLYPEKYEELNNSVNRDIRKTYKKPNQAAVRDAILTAYSALFPTRAIRLEGDTGDLSISIFVGPLHINWNVKEFIIDNIGADRWEAELAENGGHEGNTVMNLRDSVMGTVSSPLEAVEMLLHLHEVE